MIFFVAHPRACAGISRCQPKGSGGPPVGCLVSQDGDSVTHLYGRVIHQQLSLLHVCYIFHLPFLLIRNRPSTVYHLLLILVWLCVLLGAGGGSWGAEGWFRG